METFANQGLTFPDGAIIVKYIIVGNYESSLEMVTSGTFAILMRYGYRKTESENRVSFGVIFKVQTPEIAV